MIRYQKDTDNIVTLTLDMEGRSTNIINHELGRVFEPVLQQLQNEKAKKRLTGVIITSAKKDFLTGGDFEYLNTWSAQDLFEYTQQLQTFFNALESPGVPVVAAINGSAMGPGFELALACHHRIGLQRSGVRIGLPEVTLGLMPGNGGVVRLLWLLGIENAFEVLTSGERYRPDEAFLAGIIDDTAKTQEELMLKARTWLQAHPNCRRPWHEKGFSIPGGTAHDPVVARKIQRLSARLMKGAPEHQAAARAILNTLAEASKVDFYTAGKIEGRYFTHLLYQPEAKNRIKAFWYDYQEVRDGAQRPKGFGKFRPKKVAIIGAGMMGSAIAVVCLRRGMEVLLKDVSKSIADRGYNYVDQTLKRWAATGRISSDTYPGIMERIKTTEGTEEFAACDIVIEAVFENQMVKTKVIKEAEHDMDEYALMASNTVSIPISALGDVCERPANFVGLHFIPPVEDIPLVEIVRGRQTSDETIARAFDFARAIKKIPIIVKDNWGFFVSRVQNTFILEGIYLLMEGYAPALIENASRQAGMPSGALALADDKSLELVVKYENQAAQHYGDKYIQHPAVQALDLMINELTRVGRVKKAGFYEYTDDGRHIWSALTTHFPNTRKDYDLEYIKERLLFVQVIEAIWCMHEGIVRSEAEANLGSIYGWGFPAFKGGVMQFIEDYGRAAFVQRCKDYEKEFGPRYQIASWFTKQVGELV